MKTKVMGMFALLIIALSVVGFAYAHWSDSIFINGKVEMGTFCFGFTTCGPCGDNEAEKVPPKEVASMVCGLEEPEVCPAKFGYPEKTVYNKLWVNITNGYPEYVGWCNFTLDNGGTIPLDVVNWCVYVTTNDGLRYDWNRSALPQPYVFAYNDTNINGMHDPDEPVVLNIYFDWLFEVWRPLPVVPYQIDPCQSKSNKITVHIKEPALPCHTYRFEITIHAVQWNPGEPPTLEVA